MARVSFAGLRRLAVALLWLLVFVIIGAGLSIGVGAIIGPLLGGRWWIVRNGLPEVIGFGAATLVVGRWLDRHEWTGLGWGAPRRAPMWFAIGVALGGATAAAAIAMSLADGARVSLTGLGGAYLPVAGAFALGLLAAALGEELIFRGYPLRRLAEAIGPGPATALLAIGFAVAHLHNPNASAFGALNIALAAVWLSVAFFSSGMGLAWGLHAGWNATLGLVFDAPVSGVRFDVPGVDYTLGRHAWVGGGAFGPEAGVVGTLAIIAGIALLLGRRLKQPGRWLAPVEVPS